ncbi:MAG: 5-formyltetrahydrofolate cyclo-ligase [Candidatus Hadarchaeales archaeon]
MFNVRDLREKKKAEREALTFEEVLEKSRKIKEKLFSLPEFKSAKTVAFYVAKEEAKEVRTQEMIVETLELGKKVLVPFVVGNEIEFTEISGLCDLQPGTFGILEPRIEIRKKISLEQIELVVVPGIAFDLKGRRIGYGKGFYDRFLSRLFSVNPNVCVVGLAFEMQLVENIPNQKSADVPVKILITEERILRFG